MDGCTSVCVCVCNAEFGTDSRGDLAEHKINKNCKSTSEFGLNLATKGYVCKCQGGVCVMPILGRIPGVIAVARRRHQDCASRCQERANNKQQTQINIKIWPQTCPQKSGIPPPREGGGRTNEPPRRRGFRGGTHPHTPSDPQGGRRTYSAVAGVSTTKRNTLGYIPGAPLRGSSWESEW